MMPEQDDQGKTTPRRTSPIVTHTPAADFLGSDSPRDPPRSDLPPWYH